MEFSPTPSGGTRLVYRIRVNSKIPGTSGLIKANLQRNILKGLKGVPGGS